MPLASGLIQLFAGELVRAQRKQTRQETRQMLESTRGVDAAGCSAQDQNESAFVSFNGRPTERRTVPGVDVCHVQQVPCRAEVERVVDYSVRSSDVHIEEVLFGATAEKVLFEEVLVLCVRPKAGEI